MDFTIENKISKIYTQNTSDESKIIFNSAVEAKVFFLTNQAIDTFDQYCHQQEWRLVDKGKSLWWTVTFKLYHNKHKSDYVPNSDIWRDRKANLTSKDIWFRSQNHPIIIHDVENIF